MYVLSKVILPEEHDLILIVVLSQNKSKLIRFEVIKTENIKIMIFCGCAHRIFH